MRKPLAAIAAAVALAFAVGAGAQPQASPRMMEAVVTVTKIDPATRTVYTRGPNGESLVTLPENMSMTDLREGARYRVRYQEAVALAVKAGADTSAAAGGGTVTAGDKNLASVSGVRTGRITGIVEAIDPASKQITVRTSDGGRQSFLLADGALAAGPVKSGDAVTIGYQQAVAADLRSTPQPVSDPAPAP